MIGLIEIQDVLDDFQEVSLTDLNCVQLLERKDSKYVFNVSSLPDILDRLKPFYKVLTIGNLKIHPYSTYYYDTDGLTLYHHHQCGKLSRYKIRFRRYDAFDTLFFELKIKSNKQETIKKRLQIKDKHNLPDQAIEMIKSGTSLNFSELHETLANNFMRITLVNNEFTERLTIDIDLIFKTDVKQVEFPSMVVAELKQTNLTSKSQFLTIMKIRGLRQTGLSKYIMGMSLLTPGIKYNNFKPTMLQLKRSVYESK